MSDTPTDGEGDQTYDWSHIDEGPIRTHLEKCDVCNAPDGSWCEDLQRATRENLELEAEPLPPPLCKCGATCKYVGPVGGYSKACVACNLKNAKRQRRDRLRRKKR